MGSIPIGHPNPFRSVRSAAIVSMSALPSGGDADVAFFRPAHCTERESDGSFEDCVPCSGVMLANARAGADIHPVTKAEYEGLRDDGKPKLLDFMSLVELNVGLKKRYGFNGPIVVGKEAVWNALKPGMAAAALGFLKNFPAGHKLRRHGPNMMKGHCVYVARLDQTETVWWIDPLAPTHVKDAAGVLRRYIGDVATRQDLATFQASSDGDEALLSPIAKVQEGEPMLLFEAMVFDIGPGTTLFQSPSTAAPKIGTTADAHVVTSVGTPFSGTGLARDWKAIRWETGVPDNVFKEKVVYVRTVDCKNPRPVGTP